MDDFEKKIQECNNLAELKALFLNASVNDKLLYGGDIIEKTYDLGLEEGLSLGKKFK